MTAKKIRTITNRPFNSVGWQQKKFTILNDSKKWTIYSLVTTNLLLFNENFKIWFWKASCITWHRWHIAPVSAVKITKISFKKTKLPILSENIYLEQFNIRLEALNIVIFHNSEKTCYLADGSFKGSNIQRCAIYFNGKYILHFSIQIVRND